MLETTVRKVMDAFNRHDLSGFTACYAPDAVVHDPQYSEPLRGRDSIRQDMETFFRAFPDISGSLGTVLEKKDTAAFEGAFTGTNTGPVRMPGGELPPTNRTVTLRGAIFVRIDDQGQIEEERRYFDVAAMMAQLGLAPQGQG